jgi:hypothetical protein
MKKLLLDHVSDGVERSSADATTLMRPRLTGSLGRAGEDPAGQSRPELVVANDEPLMGNPSPHDLVDGEIDASVIERASDPRAMTKEATDADRPLWHRIAWDQLELDELAAIQRQVRAAIDAKRKLAGRLRQMGCGVGRERRLPEPLHGGKSGYRALVSQVAPAQLRASTDKLGHCILGVSLGGSNAHTFHGAKLEATVRWIAARR